MPRFVLCVVCVCFVVWCVSAARDVRCAVCCVLCAARRAQQKHHRTPHAAAAQTARWLADPGNKTYKVSAVYVWCLASWDVLGVYPESTTREGSYKEPAIVEMVQQHNAEMVEIQRRTGGGGRRG